MLGRCEGWCWCWACHLLCWACHLWCWACHLLCWGGVRSGAGAGRVQSIVGAVRLWRATSGAGAAHAMTSGWGGVMLEVGWGDYMSMCHGCMYMCTRVTVSVVCDRVL